MERHPKYSPANGSLYVNNTQQVDTKEGIGGVGAGIPGGREIMKYTIIPS